MFSLLLSIALASLPTSWSTQDADERTILSGVTLHDGTGAGPRIASITFANEQIERVEDGVVRAAPEGGKLVDGSGWFVVPGLMDVHTHLATDPSATDYPASVHAELRRMLGCGITCVRDMGGDGRVLTYLARQTAVADVPGPDIVFASLIAGPRFFADPRARSASRGVVVGEAPWAHHVDDETDLAGLMQRVRGIGASGVKIYADLSPELLAAVTAAARESGLAVWSHWVISPRGTLALDAVEAGVQVVSHAYMLMHQSPPPARGSSEEVLQACAAPKLFAAMRAKGTILDATLLASTRLPTPQGYVSPRSCAADIVKAARAAGVPIATGSDAPGADGLPAAHLEYRLLVQDAGMRPSDVIVSATSVSARAAGVGERCGSIAAGMEATFLVLEADPADAVEALAAPSYVVKRGVVWNGAELRSEGAVEPLAALPQRSR